MAAGVAQQHMVFQNGNGALSMPLTPIRNGASGTGTLTGEYADYDPKFLAVQHAYEEQKKTVHSLQLDIDKLNRRNEFLRNRQTEFEKAAHDAEENMQITLTQLRQAKVNEIAAQREISILEARYEGERNKNKVLDDELEGEKDTIKKVQAKLYEANTHKVDLQQAEFDNRREIITTRKKLKKAVDELNVMKRNERIIAAEQTSAAESQKKFLEETQLQLEESRKQNAVLEEQLKKLSPLSDLPSRVTEMALRMESLEAELTAREARITTLENTNAQLTSNLDPQNSMSTNRNIVTTTLTTTAPLGDSSTPSTPRPTNEIDDMRRIMELMDRKRKDAANERDHLQAVVFAEMRRAAIEEHDRCHPNREFIYQKPDSETAAALLRERAHAYFREQNAGGAVNGTSANWGLTEEEDEETLRMRIGDLEREIDFHLTDIMQYKRDVKGYKKDLKRAERRLREFNENSAASDLRLNMINGNATAARGINGAGRSPLEIAMRTA
jgi:chromosome segregation ATPase